jgi:hypothetical protein
MDSLGYYLISNFMHYIYHIVLLRQRNLGGYNGLSKWLGWNDTNECRENSGGKTWKMALGRSSQKWDSNNNMACEDGR